MDVFDLCFAWNWIYDGDFANILEKACQAENLKIFHATPDIIDQVVQALNIRKLRFRALFDRASDADASFFPLTTWSSRRRIVRINRYRLTRRAWNKAAMHRKIVRAGLQTPYTVCLPPYNQHPILPVINLTPLGKRFAIKPAHGGGGLGVIMDATAWEQVLASRQEYPDDQYLLQTQVNPTLLDGRPAWFRVIYSVGQVHPFWWNPETHRYTIITEEEQIQYGLCSLVEITQRLAELSRLELFSTEIAFDESQHRTIIDYVNDPIDLRPQSKTPEGIPDFHLNTIAEDLAHFVAISLEKTKPSPS